MREAFGRILAYVDDFLVWSKHNSYWNLLNFNISWVFFSSVERVRFVYLYFLGGKAADQSGGPRCALYSLSSPVGSQRGVTRSTWDLYEGLKILYWIISPSSAPQQTPYIFFIFLLSGFPIIALPSGPERPQRSSLLPINRVEIEKLFSSLSPSSFVVLCLHRNAVTKNIKKERRKKKDCSLLRQLAQQREMRTRTTNNSLIP